MLTRAWFTHADSPLPGEIRMRYTPLAIDTLTAGEATRRRQHAPITVRMHVDRRNAAGSRAPLARAWLDVADAPAGEASVVRWFGAARLLATMPAGVRLPPDSMQLTALVVLYPLGDGRARINLFLVHALAGLAAVDIDPARLVLPARYREVSWSGGAVAAGGGGRGGGGAGGAVMNHGVTGTAVQALMARQHFRCVFGVFSVHCTPSPRRG